MYINIYIYIYVYIVLSIYMHFVYNIEKHMYVTRQLDCFESVDSIWLFLQIKTNLK